MKPTRRGTKRDMAVLITCSLKISPPSPLFSSLPPIKSLSNFTQNKRQTQSRKEDKGSWRNQVLVGLACMIIGFEMVPVVVDNEYCCAFAEELKFLDNQGKRWSDKRMCPPWMINSLETIVPENLPRPSAHRNFEAIVFSSTAPSTVTPAAAVSIKSNCFSL